MHDPELPPSPAVVVEVITQPQSPPASLGRPDVPFMLSHPAHIIAMGFGSGLSRIAPGTIGSLWGWLAFALLSRQMGDTQWAWLIGLGLPVGWWACTITARNMRVLDPSSVVWDEIIAIWIVLWLITPTSLLQQLAAFALFRFFDAVKPGPVGWADSLFHTVDPATDHHAWKKAGFGIVLDDLVAAACTLLVMAIWRYGVGQT